MRVMSGELNKEEAREQVTEGREARAAAGMAAEKSPELPVCEQPGIPEGAAGGTKTGSGCMPLCCPASCGYLCWIFW